MIKIKILEATQNPISFIGMNAGICYGSDITDGVKNISRGMKCIEEGHGEMVEYPTITFSVEGLSERSTRQLFRHRVSTKSQESTRYKDQYNFQCFIPESISKNDGEALFTYFEAVEKCREAYIKLVELGVSKEDAANVLPMGKTTNFVYKVNLRELIHIFGLRSCSRAYSEIRELMKELRFEIKEIDNEWELVAKQFLVAKCGTCKEKHNCERNK